MTKYQNKKGTLYQAFQFYNDSLNNNKHSAILLHDMIFDCIDVKNLKHTKYIILTVYHAQESVGVCLAAILTFSKQLNVKCIDKQKCL